MGFLFGEGGIASGLDFTDKKRRGISGNDLLNLTPVGLSANIGAWGADKLLGTNIKGGLRDFTNDPSGTIDEITTPTTSTTTTVPWAAQQPYLLDTFNRGRDLIANPSRVYPGQSADTINWQNTQRNLAGNNPFMTGENSADKRLTSISSSGMPASYGNLSYAPPTNLGVGTSGFTNANYAPGNLTDDETAGYLRNTASGGMLKGNPYLDSIFDRMAGKVSRNFNETVLPGVNTTFGASGRYGSNAHQTALNTANRNLGDTLAGTAADLYGRNYDLERGYMQDSIRDLGNVNAQNLNRNLSSSQFGANFGLDRAGRVADVEGRNIDRGLSSAQFGAGFGLDKTNAENAAYNANTRNQLDAIGMMPNIRNMQYGDARALGDVGASIDAYNLAKNKYPWEELGLYSQIVSGNYGGTTTAPGPSKFDRMLGYGADAAQIALPFV